MNAIEKKIEIFEIAIAKTKALLTTILNCTTIEEAEELGLWDFMFELDRNTKKMEWKLRIEKKKLKDKLSAIKAQQLCAEGFHAWEEKDSKKHVNTPGSPVMVAHNPEILILSGLNLDNSAAEIALKDVEDKDSVKIIHLCQNNLTALPESISLFPNVEMITVDDNNKLREVFQSARNCSRTLETISASGTRCHRDEFDCLLIGIKLGL